MAEPLPKRTVRALTADRATPPVDSSGGGGNDGGMDARLVALEKALPEIADRLTKLEARSEHFATKEDVAMLRADMLTRFNDQTATLMKLINDQTWKLITFTCSFGTALATAVYFIAKNVH